MKFLEDFEIFLRQSIPEVVGFHPHFQTAFWEMLLYGGKRFRPALLLSVVQSYAPDLLENAFRPALALECLHTYSLIHDDLPCMDNASFRRSHPTLHKTYGETTATLVGDGLNTYAFYLLSHSDFKPEILVELIASLSSDGGLNGMIIGQALDCHFENQILPLEKLRTIHIHKTAKLIATSLRMGGIIASLSKTKQQEIYDFGLELGLFFQVRDDIIDCVGSFESAGKNTQNDAGKNSYVNLLGLDGARAELQRLKQELIMRLNAFDEVLKEKLNLLLIKYFEE